MSEDHINRLRRSLARPLFDEEEEAAVTPTLRGRAEAQEDALVAQILSQRTREAQRRRRALPVALALALAAALVMLWLPTPMEVPPYRLEAHPPARHLGGPAEGDKVIRLEPGNTLSFSVIPERVASAQLKALCFVKRGRERAVPWPVSLESVESGGGVSFTLKNTVSGLPIIKDWVGSSFQVAVVLARDGEHPSLEVVDGVLSGLALPRKGWQIASQSYEIITPKAAGAGPAGRAGAAGPDAAPQAP